MKAFKIRKAPGEDIEETHRLCKIYEEEASLSIMEQKEFSRIAITNPQDSNSIFVINNVILSFKDKNNIKLLMGESYLQECKVKTIGPIKVSCDVNKEKNTEINTKNVQAEKPIEMFDGEAIILLPGGGIFIEANVPLREMMLNINWIEEKL